MLCQAGVRPRVLLRDPARLDTELAEHVEPVVGDLRDADYVAEATAGVDAPFWVHPEDWSLPAPSAAAKRTGDGLAAAMRKNLLMALDGLRAGRLTTIRPLDEPMPWVDPRDIA